jgi:hypothetical protein
MHRLLESEVNTCHADALALVGWYLMVPPFSFWQISHNMDPKLLPSTVP